ncbi:hypothetical protein [Janthinobacterium sp.]|uniref:hypothetical protein n=1 Tax=Janthinobacterium sp. TaxID=1871054 RepID=UPI00293D1F2B|nr:hypothetical protein [Janthinobacterium sp.]
MMSQLSFRRRLAGPLLVIACLVSPLAAQAGGAQAVLADAMQRHAECLRPAFGSGDTLTHGVGGYGIEAQGERYWVALEARMEFPLLSRDGGEVLAQFKVDRPPSADFEEQAVWRVRWLEDVAARTGVALSSQTFADGVRVVTINKPVLKGQFAGISLMLDAPRRLFAQWDWSILPRYNGPDDLAATQAAVWRQAMPCLLKP